MAYTTETDKIRERVIPILGPYPGLDLGCGDTKICGHAIGIDLRKDSKAVVVGDASNLQSIIPKGELYDWIFSSHLLEHLKKHPKETIRDWLTFIKPAGKLVLYLPDVVYYTEKNPEHFWNFTAKQWFEELKEENIVIYEKRNRDLGYVDEYSVLVVIQK